MARFLSPEWFGELGADADGAIDNAAGPALVVQISVTGAPEGEVRYQVVVEGTRPRVLPPGAVFRPAQVELSSDYATMAGIAEGNLSAIDALSLGRARVSGDTAALSTDGPALAGLDLVPPAVRARTTF
jgi:SCP-2 sterol transfer family